MDFEFFADDFPDGFVAECSAAGDCYEAVTYWAGEIGLAMDPSDLAACLRGYGAWDDGELADHAENIKRALWIIAGDLSENGEAHLSTY